MTTYCYECDRQVHEPSPEEILTGEYICEHCGEVLDMVMDQKSPLLLEMYRDIQLIKRKLGIR